MACNCRGSVGVVVVVDDDDVVLQVAWFAVDVVVVVEWWEVEGTSPCSVFGNNFHGEQVTHTPVP